MAPNVPVGDIVAEIQWQNTQDEEFYVSTFGITGLQVGNENTFATQLSIDYVAAGSLLEEQSNLYQLAGFKFRRRNDDAAIPWITDEFPLTSTGTRGSAAPPQNISILVNKSVAGRARAGRMYWPPCFLTQGEALSNGSMLSARQGVLQTKIPAWFAAARSAQVPSNPGLDYVAYFGAPTLPKVITDWPVQVKLATQRRRLRR